MKKETKYQYETKEQLDLKSLPKSERKITKIHCPSCENEVPVADVSLSNSMAKCQSCNIVFSVEEEVNSVQLLVASAQKEVSRTEIARPEGIDIYDFRGDLDISFSQAVGVVDIIVLMLSPLLLLGLIIGCIKGIGIAYLAIIGMMLSGIIYRLMNYYTGRYKTNITVDEHYLILSHSPKNFHKELSINTKDIDQLYLKYGAQGLGLYIITNGLNGQKHQLLSSFTNMRKAKYVEQEIEYYLNIEDRKVLESNIDTMHNKNHLS